MAGRDADLPFRIELWDEKDLRVEELIALTSDYFAASCAYEEAVKRRPGTRVIKKSREMHCDWTAHRD